MPNNAIVGAILLAVLRQAHDLMGLIKRRQGSIEGAIKTTKRPF